MAYIGAKPINENNGGTNQSTYTTGDMIYASGTNTLAKLPISTVPGLALRTDGAVPIWENPLQYIYLVDDFMGGSTSSALGWFAFNNGTNTIVNTNQANTGPTSAHPGVFSIQNGTTTTGQCALCLGPNSAGSNVGAIILGGGSISMTFLCQIPVLSSGTDTYTIRIGLSDTRGGDAVNGCYFEYTDGVNSGAWQVKTASASTRTTNNTANTTDTSWHQYRIDINAAASSISYFIDGTQVTGSPITTNIPTTQIYPIIQNIKSAGTNGRNIYIDYFTYYQKLTATR